MKSFIDNVPARKALSLPCKPSHWECCFSSSMNCFIQCASLRWNNGKFLYLGETWWILISIDIDYCDPRTRYQISFGNFQGKDDYTGTILNMELLSNSKHFHGVWNSMIDTVVVLTLMFQNYVSWRHICWGTPRKRADKTGSKRCIFTAK